MMTNRLLVGAVAVMLASVASAATYTLKGSDSADHSSIAAGSKGAGSGWVNVADETDTQTYPQAGNEYTVFGYELRTPNYNSAYTFAGDKLTVGVDQNNNQGSIGFKTTGTSGPSKSQTFNDLVLLNGRLNASSRDTWFQCAGNLTIPDGYSGYVGVSSDSGDNRRMRLISVLQGEGSLVLATIGAKTAVEVKVVDGDDQSGTINNFCFTGKVYIDGDDAVYGNVNFSNKGGGLATIATAASWFGNPESFLADGLTINYGGQLKFADTIESTGSNRGFTIKNKVGTLTVADGKSVTIDAPIASTVGFKKLGTGTLVLAASSPDLTSAATVTVSEGNLRLTADNALGTANVNLAGATLLVNPANDPVAMATVPKGLTKLTIEAGDIASFKALPLFTIPASASLDLAAIDWQSTSTFAATIPVELLSLQPVAGEGVTVVTLVCPELDAPTIEASFVSATETEATFNVTVGYVTEGPSDPLTVTAYYGSVNGGVDPEGWENALTYETTMAPGTYTLTVALTSGIINTIAFADRNGEGEPAWTIAPFTVAVAAHSLSLPATAWETAAEPVELVATRARAGFAETIALTWTNADGNLAAESLPESVTFAENETEVRLPLTLVDNAAQDGDRTVSVSLVGTAACLIGANGTASIAIKDDESIEAVECVWTGAAGDHDWDNAANWQNEVRPTANDIAIFPGEAITAPTTNFVSGAHAVRKLVIDRVAKYFVLAAGEEGGSLAVKEIVDTGAEEATGTPIHALRVPLAFAIGNERGALVEVTNDKAKLTLGDFTGTCDVVKTGAGRMDLEPPVVNNFRDYKVVIADGTIYANPANKPDSRLTGMTFVLDKREHDVRLWCGGNEHKGNFRIEDVPGEHQAVYKHDGSGHTFYQSWFFTGPVFMEVASCNFSGELKSESDVTIDVSGGNAKFGAGAVNVAGELIIQRGTVSFQDNQSGKRDRPQTIVLGNEATRETDDITLGFGNKMDAFDNWSIRVNNVGREVAFARAGNYGANRTRAAAIELARDVNIRCENTNAGYGDVYTGVISGQGGISVKSSAASFVRFQAANTYEGATTITAGFCQAAANGCFSTNDVSVAEGATLTYVTALTPDEKGIVDAIDDKATLCLATGATVKFESAVTEEVGHLTIDGQRQSGGLYGALDNDKAKIKVDWITGEGLLKVKSVGFAVIVR